MPEVTPPEDTNMKPSDPDSDAELEAAIEVEPEVETVPPEDISSINKDDRNGSAHAPAVAASGPSTSSPFKLPPNPSIPQDLSIIMEMVNQNQVVGSLPPVSMTAAEKRKLVEESLKDRVVKAEQHAQPISNVAEGNENDSDTDSDSSSEFVSSSEDEDEDEDGRKLKNVTESIDVPMNEQDHTQLKKELDDFVDVQAEANQDPAEFEEDSEYTSSEEEEGGGGGDESFPGLNQMGFEFMEDDEDISGPSTSGPITSIHEAPLPAVPQPPLEKLPQGEGVSLAGDVISWMREKKVEAWLEKRASTLEQEQEKQMPIEEKIDSAIKENQKETSNDEEGEVSEETIPAITVTSSRSNIAEHKFTSAGTVVVRAMQSRPGAADEGWLEEGSVLCWEDGRVLGTVHETFGPLTSPFYTIRLPPPPFPYPASSSLSPGTRLFYPLNPSYRSFVNMLAVRDPRFKGSDASNLYDEEIGEEEMEWSDDELEMEAKRRRKARKGSKAPSNANMSSKGKGKETPKSNLTGHGLPNRPHFDYHDSNDQAESDTASLYGEADNVNDQDWERMSDNASVTSTRSRALPAPYELDDLDSPQIQPSAGARGGGGRGRGQGRERGSGRDRGRGRGRGRGGKGGSRGGAGGGGTSGDGRRNANTSNNNNNGIDNRQSFPLPPNPLHHQQEQQYHPHAQSQGFNQHSYMSQQQSYLPQSQQPFYPPQNYNTQQSFNPHFQQSQQSQSQSQSYPNSHNQPFQQQYNNNEAYEPNQPSSGMPSYSQQQPAYTQQLFPQVPQQQQQQPSFPPQVGGVPAINPRFAAQYTQMMGNQTQPQQQQPQSPAQGQGQGYGYGYGWQNQYSE
ncbi:uncharacterized protein IL334_006431 [Kwoniella shivajii]|uniref:H/ACA ribonucleoprotein complex non-core subunit NAF1 n=1 Tax=Kwoniella shivajii TaxID=564305 RepID=A0ABZ1D5Y2_9TREE|nr:hypothetical protein IL334_006431 [Kwoniella shivajii]